MMFDPSTLLSRALQIALTFYSAAGPTVRLDTAVVTGLANDHQTQSFLGIPFAEAPRFDAPVPVQPYTDQFDATKYGPACIQHKTLETATWTLRQLIEIGIIPLVPAPENQSEECESVLFLGL
jgi:carboxylesterase type B